MDELVNTRGRGSLGTATNSPVSDVNTMARAQNKPSAPQGAGADGFSGSERPGAALTQIEQDFIYEIHHARNLDGSPLSLDQLQRLRTENAQLQTQAVREFGPESKTARYYQEVVAAYDEMIADAKAPLGAATNGLRSVLANPKATERDRSNKAEIAIGIMRQIELLGQDDDPNIAANVAEATRLIVELIKVDAKEKTDALGALVNKEKGSSGAVSEDQFRKVIIAVMGSARQEQLMGVDEDDPDSGSSKIMGLVVDSLNLVADRRVATLKGVIAQEKASPGSVSDDQFARLVQGVLGDGRQKQLMGVAEKDGDGMEVVIDVMKIFLERRRSALASLFKKQSGPGGGGVNNAQIDQAIKDYETAKKQAMQWGIAVANAPEMPDQPFDAKQQGGGQ
jgi:hypothetical protein